MHVSLAIRAMMSLHVIKQQWKTPLSTCANESGKCKICLYNHDLTDLMKGSFRLSGGLEL